MACSISVPLTRGWIRVTEILTTGLGILITEILTTRLPGNSLNVNFNSGEKSSYKGKWNIIHLFKNILYSGLPQWLGGKQSTCKAGDTGDASLIPGLGRSTGEGHGNPLQCSCLGNPTDRGIWRATVHGECIWPKKNWSFYSIVSFWILILQNILSDGQKLRG